jgi:hypothetical protein
VQCQTINDASTTFNSSTSLKLKLKLSTQTLFLMSNEKSNGSCDCGCGDNCECPPSCECGCNGGCPFGANGAKTLAFWVLRAWLGARAFFTGLSKWHAEDASTVTAGAASGTDFGSEAANKAAALAPADPAGAAANAVAAAGDAAAKGADAAAAAVTKFVHHGLPQGGDWTLASFLAEENRVWYMPEFALKLFDATLGYVLVALGVAALLLATYDRFSVQSIICKGKSCGK